MPGRCRDLVPHPNQPRPTAAEATDEDNEEARAFYLHAHPPGYGGKAPSGSSLSWVFLLVASTISPTKGGGEKAERGVAAQDTELCTQPALPQPRDVIRHPGQGGLLVMTRGNPHPRRGPGS